VEWSEVVIVKTRRNVPADDKSAALNQLAALRTLERELSFSAANDSTAPPSRSIKTGAGAALAAVTLAGFIAALVMAWPLWPSLATWRPAISPANPPPDELSALKGNLAASEAAQKDLLAELEATQQELHELQKVTTGVPWYADNMVLNYRSPWPAAPRR